MSATTRRRARGTRRPSARPSKSRSKPFAKGLLPRAPRKSGVNVSSHTYGIWRTTRGSRSSPRCCPRTPRFRSCTVRQRSVRDSPRNQSTIELILMEADGDSLDPAQCKEIGRGTCAAIARRAERFGGRNHLRVRARTGRWDCTRARCRRTASAMCESSGRAS